MRPRVAVESEVGTLSSVLIHRPDRGIGNVIPQKAQEWLYEDIVNLSTMRREYDVFKKTLLAFLDMDALARCFEEERSGTELHMNPGSGRFVGSDRVVEAEVVLSDLLEDGSVRIPLVAAICGIEECDYNTEVRLNSLSPSELTKVLITGVVPERNHSRLIFPPIPNFIFTRDVGAVVGEKFMLSKFAKRARSREAILTRYMAYHHFCSGRHENVIEMQNDEHYFLCEDEVRAKIQVSIEGGDVMVIAPHHLLIGCSERTSARGVEKLVEMLFSSEMRSGIRKVSVVDLPKSRGRMHLDTVLTQVRRDAWVLHQDDPEVGGRATGSVIRIGEGSASVYSAVEIVQFSNEGSAIHVDDQFNSIEELLTGISRNDFGCEGADFIYCGDRRYPHSEREQWADGCNLLALREGIVIGYDRNEETRRAFEDCGFQCLGATEILQELRDASEGGVEKMNSRVGELLPEMNALILIPSSELSRARGGPHCLTFPLRRERVVSS